ncbi:MAG: S24 family peptidase [Coriobacteriia bacterium]|nr:S24 family peptidase [Coriobacteriia bacterium]
MGRAEEIIKEKILDKFGSISEFSRVIGVPRSTIDNALTRGFAGAGSDAVLKMFRGLNLDLDAYAGGMLREKSIDPEFVDVPIVLSVSAGVPDEDLPLDDKKHPIPIVMGKRYPNARLVKINGSSMDRLLPDGALALVDFGADVETDDIALVCVDGSDGMIKRVRVLENGVELIPESTDPTFEPTVYKCADEDCTNIEVRGKVIWWTPPFDFLIPWKWDLE